MTLTSGDRNVVSNVRFANREATAKYSDELIASVWRDFSQSDEYPDNAAFLSWLDDAAEISKDAKEEI